MANWLQLLRFSGCLPLECTSPLKTNASVGYSVQLGRKTINRDETRAWWFQTHFNLDRWWSSIQSFFFGRSFGVVKIKQFIKHHCFWKGFLWWCHRHGGWATARPTHPSVTPRQEYNRMSDSFRVTAKCADGYHGKAKARFLQQKLKQFGRSKLFICLRHLGQVQMCSKPETPYELSGCKPIVCVAPKEIETYSYLGVQKGRLNASSIACRFCVNLTACLVDEKISTVYSSKWQWSRRWLTSLFVSFASHPQASRHTHTQFSYILQKACTVGYIYIIYSKQKL